MLNLVPQTYYPRAQIILFIAHNFFNVCTFFLSAQIIYLGARLIGTHFKLGVR